MVSTLQNPNSNLNYFFFYLCQTSWQLGKNCLRNELQSCEYRVNIVAREGIWYVVCLKRRKTPPDSLQIVPYVSWEWTRYRETFDSWFGLIAGWVSPEFHVLWLYNREGGVRGQEGVAIPATFSSMRRFRITVCYIFAGGLSQTPFTKTPRGRRPRVPTTLYIHLRHYGWSRMGLIRWYNHESFFFFYASVFCYHLPLHWPKTWTCPPNDGYRLLNSTLRLKFKQTTRPRENNQNARLPVHSQRSDSFEWKLF